MPHVSAGHQERRVQLGFREPSSMTVQTQPRLHRGVRSDSDQRQSLAQSRGRAKRGVCRLCEHLDRGVRLCAPLDTRSWNAHQVIGGNYEAPYREVLPEVYPRAHPRRESHPVDLHDVRGGEAASGPSQQSIRPRPTLRRCRQVQRPHLQGSGYWDREHPGSRRPDHHSVRVLPAQRTDDIHIGVLGVSCREEAMAELGESWSSQLATGHPHLESLAEGEHGTGEAQRVELMRSCHRSSVEALSLRASPSLRSVDDVAMGRNSEELICFGPVAGRRCVPRSHRPEARPSVPHPADAHLAVPRLAVSHPAASRPADLPLSGPQWLINAPEAATSVHSPVLLVRRTATDPPRTSLLGF